MTSYQSAPAGVQAEQWLGTLASLQAIQLLVLPFSVMRCGGWTSTLDTASPHLTVPTGVDHNAVSADIGQWIVRYSSGRIAVMADVEFRETFRLVVRHPDQSGEEIDAVVERPSLREA